MSGQLRIKGEFSGYSQLEAPQEAGNQTFVFPTTGGTLVVVSDDKAPAPVGYQQGLWLPDFGSTSGQSQWVTNGLAENSDGTTTASLVGEFSATFSRIGQMVTLQALIRFQGSSGTVADAAPVLWTGLPYAPADDQTIMPIPSVVSGAAGYIGSTYFSESLGNIPAGAATTEAYIYTGPSAVSDAINLVINGATIAAQTVSANNLGSGTNQYHMVTVTYKTDDTTWAPALGRTTGVTP